MDDEKYTAIPRSSELFRAQVLREGAVGWASLACKIAGEAMADLKNAMAADELLSSETMRRPYRMAAAALLVPYLPLSAIEQALGAVPNSVSPDVMLRTFMSKYIVKWCRSTISGSASAWFRLHYFAAVNELDEDLVFSGPVVSLLLKSVARHAREKASKASTTPSSSRRNNGSSAEGTVRDGLLFAIRNCGVTIPGMICPLVKKIHWSQRLPANATHPLSIKMVWRLEQFATDVANPLVFRQTCACLLILAFGCMLQEQANCSEIWNTDPLHGCIFGCTDREKSNQPHKMVARPFWLAHVGLISAEWNQLALSTTSETHLAGVLFRENDSPDGDVSKATKLLRRPMHPMRMGVCIRRILLQVCGVPPGEVGKFGVSSFRKFLIEICKARGLPAFR
jgi:hypothetical protein